MEQNKFIVDLSGLKLSEQQKLSINKAIQKAAMNELAIIDTRGSQFGVLKGKLGPLGPRGPRLPIWWGIIIRPIKPGAEAIDIKNILIQ